MSVFLALKDEFQLAPLFALPTVERSNEIRIDRPTVSNAVENSRKVEQYIFDKLETYMNKPRLWQLTHSSHIKKRLLRKSSDIARTYSLPEDFVQHSIEQLFLRIDKYFLKLRELVHQMSQTCFKLSDLTTKETTSANRWRILELQRAIQLFPDDERDATYENVLLEKYRKAVVARLTPKENVSAKNKSQETLFDLDEAYEKAEAIGHDYLTATLHNYNVYEPPDLKLIEEMMEHCSSAAFFSSSENLFL